MKQYALLHGTCGLAEGYSETTVRWFNNLAEAVEARKKSLEGLMSVEHEEVKSTTDGMQDIIVFDSDEGQEEILKIIEVNPAKLDNPWLTEYLIWNQMDCEAPYDGDYLPTDIGVVKDLCERLEGVSDVVSTDTLHEFIRDLYYGGDAMFDADDICIYYFRVPKLTERQQ